MTGKSSGAQTPVSFALSLPPLVLMTHACLGLRELFGLMFDWHVPMGILSVRCWERDLPESERTSPGPALGRTLRGSGPGAHLLARTPPLSTAALMLVFP